MSVDQQVIPEGVRARLAENPGNSGSRIHHMVPSLQHVLIFLGVISALYVIEISKNFGYVRLVSEWGDNPFYTQIARMIRAWRCNDQLSQHFWGLPYAIAGLSSVFRIPEIASLVLISVLASIGSCVLVHRLYGGWTALAFIAISGEWVVDSTFGSSEPLFCFLLFASFLAVRRDHTRVAALLASVATTVRPVGAFALLSLAIVLTWRRRWRDTLILGSIAAAVGAAYFLSLYLLAGDPFVNFRLYSQRDWGSWNPLTLPFRRIVLDEIYLISTVRWTHSIRYIVWHLFLFAALWAIFRADCWKTFKAAHPDEALFAVVYCGFFSMYNLPFISDALPRFLIPVLPLLLLAIEPWLPKDRRLFWLAGMFSVLLAAVDVFGMKPVFGFTLHELFG